MKSLQADAKIHRDKAEVELNSEDDSRLEYAALSLRKSIEYLAYDRLNAYHKEINLDIYETWQPGKVVKHLLELDPNAMVEQTLSIAINDESLPIQERDYKEIGIEKPISMTILKKPYNSLGSYLHAPIIKKINTGNSVDFAKLRVLCVQILTEIDRVLSSTVWSTAISIFSTFDCSRCKNSAIFRGLNDEESRKVWCSSCNAPHTAFLDDKREERVKPHMTALVCATEGCEFIHEFWEDELQYEKQFNCKECKAFFRFIYSVQPLVDHRNV
jgi:hypothetical protein